MTCHKIIFLSSAPVYAADVANQIANYVLHNYEWINPIREAYFFIINDMLLSEILNNFLILFRIY